MAHRITLESRSDESRATKMLETLHERYPRVKLTHVALRTSYTIDAKLSAKELARAAAVLTNPVIEQSSITAVLHPSKFTYAVEIGFLPGVTDNVGTTVQQVLTDALGRTFTNEERVYTSFFVFFTGKLTEAQVKEMALEFHNPLIERAEVFSVASFKRGRLPIRIPRVTLAPNDASREVSLDLPEAELIRLGKEGIEDSDGTRRGPLALSLPELSAIKAYFDGIGRSPTDVELEALAQTWSEHCKHTIFSDPLDEVTDGIYRRYIRGATKAIRAKKGKNDFCISVFSDNAGGIAFDEEYLVTHKVETHNSPSALDPYGGAMTGIVGVNRDTLGFGLGAKPIANVYGFCVGEPTEKRILYRDEARTNALLSPRRILEGVVRGVEGGGNQSGIPTPLGFVYADESYRGKPLVFAGTVGLMPRRSKGRDLSKKSARPGDLVVVLGGRVGLDGIHGATFSSEALSSGSPATAVQIGDPITQKRMGDAMIRELRDAALYTAVTDNGAGGISCSVAEMARDMEQGGCTVDLAKVPLKYPGLAPWQIWISESQERMTLAVPKKHWKQMQSILNKHGVEGTVIGEFTKSGSCVVTYGKKTVMDIELEFLHDGRPQKILRSVKPVRRAKQFPKRHPDAGKTLLALLKSPNIGSYAFISEQYDHEVQGTSVTKPLIGRGRVNADAAVMRPVAHSSRGIVLSQGYAPSYSALDAYRMAAASIDTAVRNAVCAGASLEYLSILDNFCWSSSNDPERLYELKEAARACYDTAVAYGTPFISGKDSMFNDFRGYTQEGEKIHIAALPTLLVSTLGVIEDADRAMTFDFKNEGDFIYLLGTTKREFGGSEYAKVVTGTYAAGTVPLTDTKQNAKTYRAVSKAITSRLVSSALGVSRGGVAVALSKMAIAGKLGADVTLGADTATSFFSESQGRIVVTVSKEKKERFERAMKGIPCKRIGVVGGKALTLRSGKKRVSEKVATLARAYAAPYTDF